MLLMGNTLYEARIQRGLSQGTLAKMAGVSVPVITKLEKGEEITQQSLEKVCSALGIDPNTVHDVPVFNYVRMHAELKRKRAHEG